MISTGPTARIPAEAPKHADAPSGARGIRAKANRVRRASFLFALRRLSTWRKSSIRVMSCMNRRFRIEIAASHLTPGRLDFGKQ